MNKINRIIYCIIDDVRSSHFFDFIDRGLLPNFKKLMENGTYSKYCITDFPSVTYPTQPTLITGTYTGDYTKELCHGIPSYSWMGRYYAPPILRSYGSQGSDELIQVYKLNSDLGKNCQTNLEMVEEGNKTSITQFISRGTDYLYPETKIKLVFYYEILTHTRNIKRMMARSNTVVVHKLLQNFKKPKKYFGNMEVPIVSNIWFMTSDVLMHYYGYDSELYKLNLMHIDKCMGVLLKELDKMGYLDDTAIAITADHGNYKAKKLGDISPFNTHYGLSNYHPKKNRKGNVNVAEFNCVGMFYFKGKEKTDHKLGWSKPTLDDLQNFGPKRINLLEDLFKVDGTKYMYYREDGNTFNKGNIHLKRKIPSTGKLIEGSIEYKGSGPNQKTKYVMDNEEDIFGFIHDEVASKLIDGKFHTINEWMEGTYHLDYPLYPDLIPRHFKNPRSSDIIISTSGEVIYNIEHGKQKNERLYNHDIGLQKSAIVPLIIAGSPEIPIKEIKCCKTVDIVPTIINLLGKKPHKSVVGDNLF